LFCFFISLSILLSDFHFLFFGVLFYFFLVLSFPSAFNLISSFNSISPSCVLFAFGLSYAFIYSDAGSCAAFPSRTQE
jgi:hypothetical protein